jgi:hypothetical protein
MPGFYLASRSLTIIHLRIGDDGLISDSSSVEKFLEERNRKSGTVGKD